VEYIINQRDWAVFEGNIALEEFRDHVVFLNIIVSTGHIKSAIRKATGMNLGETMLLFNTVSKQHQEHERFGTSVDEEVWLGQPVDEHPLSGEEKLQDRTTCCTMLYVLSRIGSFKDFLMPVDHRPEWRKKIFYALSGTTLKEQVFNILIELFSA